MGLWLNHMAVFAAVVRSGSFTAASESLGLPKSTVSQRIAELEAAVGTQLLLRTTRAMHLTESGRALLPHCEDALRRERLAFEAARAYQTSPHGRVSISAPNVLGSSVLAPFVAEFLQRYPNVEIELALTDQLAQFGDSGVDVAFRVGEAVLGAGSDQFVVRSVGAIHFILCAVRGYQETRGLPTAPADLSQHACLPHKGAQKWELVTAEGGVVEAFEATGRLKTDNLTALKEACLSGFGIAFLPSYLCQRELDRGELLRVLPAWRAKPLALSAVYPKNGRPTKAFSLFLREATARLRAFLGNRRHEAVQGWNT
jgi:DNA-binding transcriptional LysR family regulator